MVEIKKGDRVARIIDVTHGMVDTWQATVLVGDAVCRVSGQQTPPCPGDIYRIDNGDPLTLGTQIGGSAPGAWSERGDALRWRTPNRRGQKRLTALRQRHAIRRAVRDYLDGEGFIEIDTPLLVRGTTPDAFIQSFKLEDRYLITSSEYQIKRLEVGGFDSVYTLTQNFRAADGDGLFRNQEFTMLEWARVGGSLGEIENDVEQMVRRANESIGGKATLRFKGIDVDLTGLWERLTVAAAVERVVGTPLRGFDLESLRCAVKATGIAIQASWHDDVCFLFSVLIDHIQPMLGLSKPVFLRDWPAFETSSAAEKKLNKVVERSELFIAGVEVADGFPSLTSEERQLQTFDAQQERRRREGMPEVETDQAYLNAMRLGLPQGAGMALGFDRLVMLLTDREHIHEVLAFAWDEL